MIDATIIKLAIELLWLVLILSLPIIVVAAVVGVFFSFFQALTQIQDQTLQFLVKLLAASATLVLTYHWMGEALFNYMDIIFSQISNVGRS